MSKIEIRYFTGDIEERELSKTQPVSIGRQTSNDVCIDEDDVGAIHCRIAWNKSGYEIAAAHSEGVELNGILVKISTLSSGDIIRIGTVDISVVLDEPSVSKVSRKAPLPDDFFKPDALADGKVEDPDDIFEEEPAPRNSGPELANDNFDSDENLEAVPKSETDDGKSARKGPSIRDRIRNRIDAQSARPGEREVIRSKFIITIGVGSLVLLLVAAILWFWTQRNASEKLYEEAKAKHEEDKYAQAIEIYSEFLQKYPRNELATTVHFDRGYAKIDRHLSGAASDWETALKEVETFIKEHRDREGYKDQKPKLLNYAQRIAKGAAKTAEKRRQQKFLPIAESAMDRSKLLEASGEFQSEYTTIYRSAEAAVKKEETFQAAVANMKTATIAKDTMGAIQARLDLFGTYSTFDKKNTAILAGLLKQILDMEKSLIERTEVNADALNQDRLERGRKPLSLTVHFRQGAGDTSGKTDLVIALAKQCCYGVDPISGDPIWRRAIGEHTPFFPIKQVSVVVGREKPSLRSLLLFDTDFGELIMIERQTGQLIWRQPLRTEEGDMETMYGQPVVHDGLIYAATESNSLYKLALDSGRILSKLTFTQPISATPMLTVDRKKLILAGNKALFYTVALSPKMSCESVTHIGHRQGTIVAPLRSIGKLMLVCENDNDDKCKLRILNSTPKGTWLAELTPTDDPVRVDGTVDEMPVLRNNKLFVTSSGERITVFSVTDDDQQPEASKTASQFINELAAYTNKSAYKGPIYLVVGPNNQIWMATNRLRKFQLKPRTVQPDTDDTAKGRATQPPQIEGKHFYLGREFNFSTGINFTRTNRERMKGEWQLNLGGSILSWSSEAGSPIVCLNENGQILRVDRNDLSKGGFKLYLPRVALLAKPTTPFRAFSLGGGNIGVTGTVEDETKIWVVNSSAQEVQSDTLPGEIQADPVLLKNGVIFPLPGRLKLFSLKTGAPSVGDYEMEVIQDEKQPRWTYLTVLNGQVIATDERGGIVRVQLNDDAGQASLVKAVARKLDRPVTQGMTVLDKKLIITDSSGQLHWLSSSSLTPTTSHKLPETATNNLWSHNGHLYVETANQHLRCFKFENNEFKQVWKKTLLSKSGLAGSPISAEGSLLIAERNGAISWINPQNGETRKTFLLGEGINHIPRKINNEYVVPSIDGSLHRIPLQSPKTAGGKQT